MRKATSLTLIATVIAWMVMLAPDVQANMPPPEPFALGITAKMTADGLRLTSVAKGSHAESAGLKVGDTIIGADARYVKSLTQKEMKQLVEGLHVWKAELIIVRAGRDIVVIDIRA